MTPVTIPQRPELMSRLVNGVLSIAPLANFAKHQARQMMIKRAEKIGVPWRDNVKQLQARDWSREWQQVNNPDLIYPDYYLTSFHAYDEGNLSWKAALEVESAAQAVHAGIWSDAGAQGDARLRASYHEIIQAKVQNNPHRILDLGCSVGMSTMALQACYPEAEITGIDLSPYYLAVAQYRTQERGLNLHWLHRAAESTGLEEGSFDLISAFLMFHELPQTAAIAIIAEAARLLRPGGYFTLMDMNPQSPIYGTMPPYIFTLLKSTEPYLDQYFTLDLDQVLQDHGFSPAYQQANTPRHRTVIAQLR